MLALGIIFIIVGFCGIIFSIFNLAEKIWNKWRNKK
jgi:uncharacterized membrane protein YuzA (DUF378 family)